MVVIKRVDCTSLQQDQIHEVILLYAVNDGE